MMHTFLRRFASAALAALVALVAVTANAQSSSVAPAIDRANMDTTCAACQDFYQYANGGWKSRATIPAPYAGWGSLQQLSDKNEAVVHDILDDAAKGVPSAKVGSNAWKIGTFYGAGIHSARVQALRRTPPQPTPD